MNFHDLVFLLKRHKNNPDLFKGSESSNLSNLRQEIEYFLAAGRHMIQMAPPGTEDGLKGLLAAVESELLSRPYGQSDKDLDQPEKAEAKGFTKSRQVEAMLFIFDFLKVEGIDQTNKAKFIEFLTGKNYQNIYEQVLSNPTTKEPFLSKKRKADLQFIRTYFDNLGLRGILVMIDNELNKPLEKNIK